MVATNDVHGRLWQLPLFGGYLQNLRAARAKDGGGVILLDAGDIFQGTLASCLSEGAAMVRGYRALRYDAIALGNHEFDFGPAGARAIPHTPDDDPFGALRARIAEAPFPFLSANLRAHDGGESPLHEVRPSMLLDVAGVRVGVIGGLTEHALTATHGANVTTLSLAPLADSIARESRALRAAGARLVIAAVHAGGDCRSVADPDDLASCEADSEVFRLARALGPLRGESERAPLVDLILGGHTHAFVAHRVAGIPIAEAGANGAAFSRVDLTLEPSSGAVSARILPPQPLCDDRLDAPVCAREPYEGAPVTRDPAVLAAIQSDLTEAQASADRALGVMVVSPVERSSQRESPLTNLVADLMLRAMPGADAAFSNPGAIRISLPVGPLTYGRVFEMFPFDNRFASLRMRAGDLARVVANSLQSDRGLVSLAGVRATARCEAHRLRVSLTDRQGKPLAPSRRLTVVTSDYLAATGDGLMRGIELPKSDIVLHPDPFIRDALVPGFQTYDGGKLDGRDPRMYDPKHPRIQFTGTRPVNCQ